MQGGCNYHNGIFYNTSSSQEGLYQIHVQMYMYMYNLFNCSDAHKELMIFIVHELIKFNLIVAKEHSY